MTPIEIIAVVFGVAYVLLAIKSNKWCWIAGIISSGLYIVFDLQLKYFQDAILQTYYVAAGAYGWYLWTRKPVGDASSPLAVNTKPFIEMLPLLGAGLLVFPVMGYGFSKIGNSFSYVDAFTTVFSFIATYYTAKKLIESWLMWVFLDLIFIMQYFLKHAYLTSGLYLFLTIMAVWGYIEWRKQGVINKSSAL
ncbi:MAG TPA: nicotinamide riboside transporter PnuC [Chitinophagales bacterium]|nr:nicotinamide riboside transporter PnuC [Chitinophagales bacterium]